jgi:cobalt/nickel transport system permease protein
MHMSDALISPAVGATGWAVASGLIAYSVRRLRREPEAGIPALMGVLGAFVFAAQMINFSIPGTGSSGHLGGGLMLSAIVGPHAAFLVLTSVLTVQALLFADGGLLALGCNIVNLGLFTCFVAYPLVFRFVSGAAPTRGRLTVAAGAAAVVGLQLGSLAVVLETAGSGISQLPIYTFVLFMLPIHFGIGVVEGIVTAGVLLYVGKARPELLRLGGSSGAAHSRSLRPLLVAFAGMALLIGGVLSWFASTQPDGLDWSVSKTAHTQDIAVPATKLRGLFAGIQRKTALLPDYTFESGKDGNAEVQPRWPAADAGTSFSGFVGAGITLLVAFGAGLGLRLLRSRAKAGTD